MSDPRPPKSPRKGKYVNIRIVFLNDTVHVFQVPVKGTGALLWDAVVNHLQLLEADYFDLEFTNHHGDECWLEKDKPVLKQLGSPDVPLRFCVKFYTPDPGLLEDELTRFLFALQVRKDLLRGELRCSENTASLLASYVVQAEIGDFDFDEYGDPTYLTVFKFVPEHLQNHEFMAKVMDYHRQHIGESPSEADLNLLDTARKVELYGVKMWSAKDHENVSLNLAVAHLGVLVFQQHTKINTFSWAKVRKLSFKRKKFLIKLHADTYGYYKDTVEFFFETRDRCKLFWKRCIEHHAFFRCQMVSRNNRSKSRVVSRGSSFRYSGRTQKQLVEFVRENVGKRPHFERSTSGRISSRSTSVTPKMVSRPHGMHSSSADLQTSSGSRSSGSHILMESNHTPNSGGIHSAPHSGTHRVESVDVHSDSSMSGSRSLNSPRLEHGLSIDQEVIEAVNARTEGAMTDDDDEEEEAEKQEVPQDAHRRGVPHVSSDTKGAECVISPELHSPVRYVGLCSDFYSQSPDLDPAAAASANPLSSSSTEISVGNSNDNLCSSGRSGDASLVVESPGASRIVGNGKVVCAGNPSTSDAATSLEQRNSSNSSSSKDSDKKNALKGLGSARDGGGAVPAASVMINVQASKRAREGIMPDNDDRKKKNNEQGSSTVSIEGGGSGSRSNLELKLDTSTITATTTTITTNNTSLSSLSSPSSLAALPSSSSSVLTTATTTNHSKHSSSTNHHQQKHLASSASSTAPPPSSSTTITTTTTTTSTTPIPSTTHTFNSSSSQTPSTPSSSSTSFPTSVSQNANKKLGKLKSRSLSRETHIPSSTNQTSPQLGCSTNQIAHANVNGNVNVTANANTNVKFNSLELRRSSSEKTSRQVRSSETGLHQQHNHCQQQQQQRQSPVCGGDVTATSTASTPAATTTDLSPPFPPPPPPLTPQQLEEEMRRRSLDASPSSCIIDAAAQMQQHHHHQHQQHHHHHHQQQQQPHHQQQHHQQHQQHNHQVRLSSMSTTTPTTPTTTPKLSSIDSNTTFDTQAIGSSSSSSDVHSTADPKTASSINKSNQQQQQMSSSDSVKPKNLPSSDSMERKKSSSKDHQPSPPDTTTIPKQPDNSKDQRKKHLSNGQAVGAGAGVPATPTALPQRLAPSDSSRKLSAGTDLIEDIPYILRRRLDGQKEETAVFKASEAGKLKKENKVDGKGSPKEKDSVVVGVDPRRRSETRNTKPPSDLKLKNVDTAKQSQPQDQMSDSMRSKRSSSRSPSLTRRVEFFYVNKLPSRNSYSSVDDTASPSKDEEMMKQLELSVCGKGDAAESSGKRTDVMTSSVDEEEKEDVEEKSNTHQEGEKSCDNAESKFTDLDEGRMESCKESLKEDVRTSKEDVERVIEEGQGSEDSSKPENGAVNPSGHSVEKPLACKKSKKEESSETTIKPRGSVDETASDGVQFYSPKIPGTRIFKKVIRTSTSDESPDSVQSPPHIRTSVSSAEFSDSQADLSSARIGNANNLQYFEVSKPEVYSSKDNGKSPQDQISTSLVTKPVPKSLSLKTDVLPSTSIPHPSTVKATGESVTGDNVDGGIDNDDDDDDAAAVDDHTPISSLHPHKTTGGATEPSQFLIDLPSPAAALFYSNSSPPQTHDKDESSSGALTFSTFRPDPADEAAMEESAAATKERSKSKPIRWSLHSPVDIEGIPDFQVVMSEGAGIIEKSALKKRRNHDPSGKPKEPKRVSWHDDGDVQYSYLSDVSMTAHRSPVEECDTSSLFSGLTTPVDSGDILETLENLRRQNSESDMTNSGSSVSSSECSDIENEASAKQIYLQYADAKGLSQSSGDGTLESERSRNGVCSKGLSSDRYHKGTSPLRCLESVSGLSGSEGSFSTLEKGKVNPHDSSPLETLEHLSQLSVNDTFDEDDDDDVAGEDADDEDDDEPNYPPPPPLMDLPDDMLMSYESDMPLPDFRDHPCSVSSNFDPLDCLEGATASSSRGSSMVVAVYSSDSDNDNASGAGAGRSGGSNSWLAKRMSIDPLAALELGDLVGNVNCTTSESESDFDAEEANTSLRSVPSCEKGPSSSQAAASRSPPSSVSTPGSKVATGSSSSQQTPPPPPPKKPHRLPVSSSSSTVRNTAVTSTASASQSRSPMSPRSPKDSSLDVIKKKSGPPKVLSKPKNYPGLPKTFTTTPMAAASSSSSSHHSHKPQPATTTPTPNNSNTTTVISPRPMHLNSSHPQNADARKVKGQGHAISPSSPRTHSVTPSTSSPRTPTSAPPPSTLRTSTPPTVKTKPKVVSPRQPQMGLGRHYERMRNDSRSSTSSSSSSLTSSSSSVVQKTSSPPSSSQTPESNKQTAPASEKHSGHHRLN